MPNDPRRQNRRVLALFVARTAACIARHAQKISIEVLLGEDLTEQEYRESLEEFYHYIDLCEDWLGPSRNVLGP